MRIALLALTALLAACEYLPFSGGELQGTLTEPPTDWTQIASPNIIELETNPSEPYSVKLWIIGDGPKLYVHAGANRATWVEHMEVDPRVKVLIEGALFELAAERITSQDEFNAFADVYEKKYGNRPRNEDVNEAYLFNLKARGP